MAANITTLSAKGIKQTERYLINLDQNSSTSTDFLFGTQLRRDALGIGLCGGDLTDGSENLRAGP